LAQIEGILKEFFLMKIDNEQIVPNYSSAFPVKDRFDGLFLSHRILA
jgi:hypothetical protein